MPKYSINELEVDKRRREEIRCQYPIKMVQILSPFDFVKNQVLASLLPPLLSFTSHIMIEFLWHRSLNHQVGREQQMTRKEKMPKPLKKPKILLFNLIGFCKTQVFQMYRPSKIGMILEILAILKQEPLFSLNIP